MTVNIKPYQQIELLAESLRQDGRLDLAEKLLHAHEGIFNGTELYFTWITHLDHLLREKLLSQATRLKAEQLLERLNRDLQPKTYGKVDAKEVESIPLTDDDSFASGTKH